MKPYGISKKMRKNFTDCHPKKLGKGWKNWWEVELGGIDKGAARQEAKRDIRKEINDD